VIGVLAWAAAAGFALLVLGFCAWELFWRARRLQGDLAEVRDMAVQAGTLRGELAAAQRRLASARRS
jgi:type VI protein secretion system component VasK